jgi:Luciferase-like monooxygenase
MKLGAVVGMRDDPAAFGRHLKAIEEAGVEYLWAGEAYSADSVSTMGFIAAATSRARIGSAILPLYTRTPTLLAMTAAGLDKLSGGRSILGIGASGPQVVEGFHGVPYDAPSCGTGSRPTGHQGSPSSTWSRSGRTARVTSRRWRAGWAEADRPANCNKEYPH